MSAGDHSAGLDGSPGQRLEEEGRGRERPQEQRRPGSVTCYRERLLRECSQEGDREGAFWEGRRGVATSQGCVP